MGTSLPELIDYGNVSHLRRLNDYSECRNDTNIYIVEARDKFSLKSVCHETNLIVNC